MIKPMNVATTVSGAIIAASGRYRFRRLGEIDRADVIAHLRRISATDLRDRFLGHLDRHVLEARYRALDLELNTLFGCFDCGHLYALLQISRAAFLPEADFGISIEEPYRRRGIATGLCNLAVDVAPDLGVRRLVAFCRSDNAVARHILHKTGFAEDRSDPSIVAAWRNVHVQTLAPPGLPGQWHDFGSGSHRDGELDREGISAVRQRVTLKRAATALSLGTSFVHNPEERS